MVEDGSGEFEDVGADNPFASAKSGSIPTIAPGELGTRSGTVSDSGTGSGEPAKKRGRKAGSKNTSKEKASINISGLEALLFSVHAALSAATQVPELALDASEARELAKAAAEVQKHYDSVIDPKTLAWIQLGTVAASVYGTRAMTIYFRKQAEAKQRKVSNVIKGNFPDHAPTG